MRRTNMITYDDRTERKDRKGMSFAALWPGGSCRLVQYTFPYASIHLHDEGPRQGPPAGYQGPRRHLAVVLFRREDRRTRLERGGQELAAANHGGRGHELHRRSVSRGRHLDRLPAAGAAAQSCEDGPGERGGGGCWNQDVAHVLRRSEREARRRSVSRRHGEGHGRAVADS